MSSTDAERHILLERRLALVGAMSALNAEALRTLQQLAGIEIDVQRLEDEAGDGEMRDATALRAATDKAAALRAATDKAAALRAAEADCAARIGTVEAEMAEIDRRLAALAGN
ncbi:hypothetical protein [Acidiphilium sp. C61]|jgi:uncharacterized protein YceH (UPF0502 family)|uniref:hypothetical protein n=1 Tax=Acidiphilium sp. C61 TaxID=1671485 RepID=UPI00157BA9C9|nr:hypothetical protein [Acidiphilium sp. C61]